MFKSVYVRKRYCPIRNCVYNMGTPGGDDVSFFQAPLYDHGVRDKWVENIQAHQEFDSNATKIKVCELHFKPEEIVQGKQRKTLKKGGYPTVFPERINSAAGPLDPLDRLNILPVGPKAVLRLTCKQCIEKACDLSSATAKLYDLGVKVRKKTNKILDIQHEMEARLSRIIPLRIEEPSQDNQNYIPQKTLKKNPILERIDVDESRASDCQEPMERSADDVDRSNEQTENAVATPNEEESDDDNDDDDDCDPPECERQQFATYIMSSISELPEQSAIQAIAAIRLYLKNWPGYADNK